MRVCVCVCLCVCECLCVCVENIPSIFLSVFAFSCILVVCVLSEATDAALSKMALRFSKQYGYKAA